MATTLADLASWETVPKADRQRLAHYLASGARRAAESKFSSGSRQQVQDMIAEILDTLADITMSLWDPMPTEESDPMPLWVA